MFPRLLAACPGQYTIKSQFKFESINHPTVYLITKTKKKLVNRPTNLLRIQYSISIVDLSSRVIMCVLGQEVTPRAVHSLWDNINAYDLRAVIGMLCSPPLKRHLSLAEYWHVIPNGQTWPQQQPIPCGHSRSRHCHHDQQLHSIKRQLQTIVQEPARRMFCTVGQRRELFVC